MIDAYELQQKLFKLWQEKATLASGNTAKKSFPAVPVYVKVEEQTILITNITLDDGKIILGTDNE